MTAKGGFINEIKICNKFNSWQTDVDVQKWLLLMGYEVDKIKEIKADHIPVRISEEKVLNLGISPAKYEETIKYKKADIQVRLEIIIDDILHVENISLKKANRSAGFNQVDKRQVKNYKIMWNFNDEIEQWLKAFTGEILPDEILPAEKLNQIRDNRRLFFTEIPSNISTKIIDFFTKNKLLIITDIIRGRGGLSAEWMLVTRQDTINSNQIDWILKDINSVCNFFAQGEVKISPRGSLSIGKVTMQRKGGTPDPTSLQFKINPLQLFAS